MRPLLVTFALLTFLSVDAYAKDKDKKKGKETTTTTETTTVETTIPEGGSSDLQLKFE